jgi:uncharacterized protein (TIGR03382 family)
MLVRFHNTEKGRRALREGDFVVLQTDHPVRNIWYGKFIGFTVGEGGNPNGYKLDAAGVGITLPFALVAFAQRGRRNAVVA